jgi:hypothetical protein
VTYSIDYFDVFFLTFITHSGKSILSPFLVCVDSFTERWDIVWLTSRTTQIVWNAIQSITSHYNSLNWVVREISADQEAVFHSIQPYLKRAITRADSHPLPTIDEMISPILITYKRTAEEAMEEPADGSNKSIRNWRESDNDSDQEEHFDTGISTGMSDDGIVVQREEPSGNLLIREEEPLATSTHAQRSLTALTI